MDVENVRRLTIEDEHDLYDLSHRCRGDLVPDMTGGRQVGTDACSEIPHADLRFALWSTAHERKKALLF